MNVHRAGLLAGLALLLLMAALTAIGCGSAAVTATSGPGGETIATIAEQTTMSVVETVTTAMETTTTVTDTTTSGPPTSSGPSDPIDEIRAALASSGRVAEGFRIIDFKISGGDWAGVIVSAANVDDVSVLLNLDQGAWRIVTLGSDLSIDDLLEFGAPQEIAELIGGPSKVPAVSDKAIAYAESIGGTSHMGEHLYFVIGASMSTEQACQTLLDKAIPKFGDMQSYFIIQRSDNFQGLSPGWYIVIEAYKNPPDQYNLEFGRRGFPDLYVKSVTVKTSDPIPVYEDM
jgi:hypothetical protein